MVHFVGAGPGAPDLLTLRGAKLLSEAGCIIYAGSLVNPALLGMAREGCSIYNSAEMTLEQVLEAIRAAEAAGHDTVRLHTGDPCVYGAIKEQMDALDALGILWDDTPGVSSFCGAAAAVGAEYTLPGVSQSVIITRLAGRTPVPARESLAAMASHGASMVIFLSAGMLEKIQAQLLQGGVHPQYPRRHRLQGHLARGKNRPVHGGHPGGPGGPGGDPQDRPDPGGRLPGPGRLRAEQAL